MLLRRRLAIWIQEPDLYLDSEAFDRFIDRVVDFEERFEFRHFEKIQHSQAGLSKLEIATEPGELCV